MQGRFATQFALRAAATVVWLFAACSDVDRYPVASETVPPDAVSDATLRYDVTGDDAVLEWTAPQTNGKRGDVARYDIRFSYGTRFDWDTAMRVTAGPMPASPGEAQSYRFAHPELGRVLRAAVRSIDVSGGVSDPGNVAVLQVPGISLSGTVTGALDRAPIAMLRVRITISDTTRVDTTDARGRWSFSDLPQDVFTVRIESTAQPVSHFPIEMERVVTENTDLPLLAIPFAMSTVYPTKSRLAFFKDAVDADGTKSVLRSWSSRPVDVYIPELVNAHDIDYHAVAIDAVDRWMALTGANLFRFVDTAPDTGVTMSFLSPSEMGINIGITHHENNPDGTPLHSNVRIVDTFSDPAYLRRVMLHELGHTLRLQHLPSGFLMYAGQPLPDDPTDDEVWITQVLVALPNGTDVSIYHEVGE